MKDSDKENRFIEATNYIRRGEMGILRSALPRTDPESWESLWKDKYGSLDDFPYYELFGVEPLFRMTRETLKEVIRKHDENPNKSLDDILDEVEIEPDFSEYGT